MTETIVETAYGKIFGIMEQDVYSFKGIPYGGPTGGPNRFMPPTKPMPWVTTRDCRRYGPSCWQVLEMDTRIGILGAAGIDSMSEDCLVLNVWTQGLNDQKKRPVMVWIHGGGFFLGSGDHLPCYDGANLVRTGDVVLVSVNHRLGVFGYLNLEHMGGDRYSGSGNAGMQDLVAALEWVRDNIETFGGDPGNVTIFGESGGGAKVSLLLGIPSAKGLFHRAIIESGPCLRALPLEKAIEAADEFLKITGINRNNIDLLHKMRADMIYSAWIATATTSAVPGMPKAGAFAPVVDGKILPAHPFDPIASTTSVDIPIIIGTNRDETTFMLMRDPEFGRYNEETMRNRIYDNLKFRLGYGLKEEILDRLILSYQKTRTDATPHDMLIDITSDFMRVSSIRLAERKAAGGTAPVFMYLFTWESHALNGMLKSCHTLEMPFVFNNVEPAVEAIGNSPERFGLAERMSKAWKMFAKSGDPNHNKIPHWPSYSQKNRATMIIDNDFHVENDPGQYERNSWADII